MSRFDEHLFGRLAVFNGYLTAEQLQECLAYQRSVEPTQRQPIGEILLERGYLSEDQLTRILDIRRKKLRRMLLDSRDLVKTERAFGRQALARGFIDAERLEKALLEQQRLRRLNLQLCLGDIMVSLGFMTVDQVLEILALQRSRILVCPKCDSHFTVRSYSAEKDYRCKYCESSLEVPRFLDTVATDGLLDEETPPDLALEEGEITEVTQVETSR